MSHRIRIHVRRHVAHDGMWAATCEVHGFTHWALSQKDAIEIAEGHYFAEHRDPFARPARAVRRSGHVELSQFGPSTYNEHSDLFAEHAKNFLPADRLRVASTPSDATRAAGRN